MNRRAFLAGTTGGLVLLSGCIADQPSGTANDTTTVDSPEPSATEPTGPTTESTTATSEPAQRTGRACNGARGISFYGLGTQFEDQVWGPGRVTVAFGLGAGAHVLLVVYEDNEVLGTAQATAPSYGGASVDGQPIPLETTLSGEHTIRVVMYGDVNQDGQFDAKTATPCRYEGDVIQTEPRTIDFSKFADSPTSTIRNE
jgi:hypothetical protein